MFLINVRSILILFLFTLVLTVNTVLPKLSLAQDTELPAAAEADDSNGDGLLQKNEAKYPQGWDWKANFDLIDCDKNSGLDGAEIYRFRKFKQCPDQEADANIYHQKAYPKGSGPFPAVIALHSSGGAGGSRTIIENYRKQTWLKAGYVWYGPNFFERHGITRATRMDTFNGYRSDIEKELTAIVALMKTDPRIDSKNIFAVGFSNGGFWASFLAAKGIVTAGASHYGVWKAGRDNPYPAAYFSSTSSPLLALHGEDDSTQTLEYYLDGYSKINDTPGFEDHVYKGAGHCWDCFPFLSKWYVERYPNRAPRILKRLKQKCAENFDGPNRAVTNDSLKRTLSFFKKHTK